MRALLFLLLSFGLVSCRTPLVLTPEPAPTTVFVSYPPFLQPELHKIAECAEQNPNLSVLTITDLTAPKNLSGPILKLQLSSDSINEPYAYQIGKIELIIIVNSDNPVDTLSSEDLRAIYTGEKKYWNDNKLTPIQLWSYPAEDSLRSFMENALPGTPRLTLEAQIAPNPHALLEVIIGDSTGIGYLPASWLETLTNQDSSRIKVVSLDESLQEKLTHSIIVTLNEPFSFETETLVVCLQHYGE